ncbi:hypothetical protein J6590_062375 [Homalodisca vitripennis]|nr:hypothetical protein J6590_062375 [Homalodisca vitripennis]
MVDNDDMCNKALVASRRTKDGEVSVVVLRGEGGDTVEQQAGINYRCNKALVASRRTKDGEVSAVVLRGEGGIPLNNKAGINCRCNKALVASRRTKDGEVIAVVLRGEGGGELAEAVVVYIISYRGCWVQYPVVRAVRGQRAAAPGNPRTSARPVIDIVYEGDRISNLPKNADYIREMKSKSESAVISAVMRTGSDRPHHRLHTGRSGISARHSISGIL